MRNIFLMSSPTPAVAGRTETTSAGCRRTSGASAEVERRHEPKRAPGTTERSLQTYRGYITGARGENQARMDFIQLALPCRQLAVVAALCSLPWNTIYMIKYNQRINDSAVFCRRLSSGEPCASVSETKLAGCDVRRTTRPMQSNADGLSGLLDGELRSTISSILCDASNGTKCTEDAHVHRECIKWFSQVMFVLSSPSI